MHHIPYKNDKLLIHRLRNLSRILPILLIHAPKNLSRTTISLTARSQRRNYELRLRSNTSRHKQAIIIFLSLTPCCFLLIGFSLKPIRYDS